MRLNKFIANSSGLSRRAADNAITEGRVKVGGKSAKIGQEVTTDDKVVLDDNILTLPDEKLTIILNKPVGYVCSRKGQGSKTIYDLLPKKYHHLKTIGRLDKDSSGLLLLTNAGELAHKLTHPSFQKEKVYEVELDKPMAAKHLNQITEIGVDINGEYTSRFQLQQPGTRNQKVAKPLIPNSYFLVTLTEGKNRQIRRTFAAAGYKVTLLHRTRFGGYDLNGLPAGQWKNVA